MKVENLQNLNTDVYNDTGSMFRFLNIIELSYEFS